MPTGYTSALHDGKDQTFSEFAMNCARAFGALVMLRDDPTGAIPDEFPPSEYDKRSRDEALSKLIGLEMRTRGDWAEAQRAELAEHNAHVATATAQKKILRDRYNRMLADVQAWQPPTEEHDELKKFMTNQLEESIRFDCRTSYLDTRHEEPLQQYIDHTLRTARDQYERAEKRWEEEQARAAGRTRWIRALRTSLPNTPSDAAALAADKETS